MIEITVVGAGLAGLAAALRLAEAGYPVRVHERYPHPGGLARVFTVGGEPLEVFYHHLFTSDTAYVELAAELGLADAIQWLPSRMGIWTRGRLWDFGTPGSLLRFRPLGPLDKARFVLSTLLLQRAQDPRPFEDVPASEWLVRHQGRRVWDTVWGPLFHQKFARYADQVAMVWLWRKLYLRGRSRTRSGMGERLGYMEGSFARFTSALASRVESLGGTVELGDPVRRIERAGEGLRVVTRTGSHEARRVLCAIPVPDYLEIAGHLLEGDERGKLGELRATGALCTILEMDRSLTPYYWLNVADPHMPFGGLIEHTNYIPAERYGGTRILYISNYVMPDDPLMDASVDDVLDLYLPALERINPDFDRSWITGVHHFKAHYAQPIVLPGYRRLIPDFRASVPGLYLCTMAQIYPEDRGQNYAVEYGQRVARTILEDLGRS